jgi:hypothetical protein
MADEISNAGKLAYPVWPDTGRAMGLSRNSAYEGVRKGEIPSIKVGGRILVPAWFHERLRRGDAA